MVTDEIVLGIDEAPAVEIPQAPEPHPGYNLAKRLLDVTGALCLLTLGAPLLVGAGGLILITSGPPVFFKQQRLGFGGRAFTLWKLRTMVPDAEARRAEVLHLNVAGGPAFKASDDPRLTALGKWLRRLSIDELPQAYNVLRGDMSLVGPRPLPVTENRYHGEQFKRLSVKPGLTCIWQTSGRSQITFEQWMDMDLRYVRERSIWEDLRLIWRTVPAVLSNRGAV